MDKSSTWRTLIKPSYFASGAGLNFPIENLYIGICEITKFQGMPITVAQIDDLPIEQTDDRIEINRRKLHQ